MWSMIYIKVCSNEILRIMSSTHETIKRRRFLNRGDPCNIRSDRFDRIQRSKSDVEFRST